MQKFLLFFFRTGAVYLRDQANVRQEMNAEYEKWFSHKPARSCVAVKTLPKNVDVEIEAVALPGEEVKQ